MTLKTMHPQAEHDQQHNSSPQSAGAGVALNGGGGGGGGATVQSRAAASSTRTARPVASSIDHSCPASYSMKHVHANPRGRMKAAEKKRILAMDNDLLESHVASIRKGEQVPQPAVPTGQVCDTSRAKLLQKKKQEKQKLIDRENEDLKSRLSGMTSCYSGIFSAPQQPRPPPGGRGSRQRNSPRNATAAAARDGTAASSAAAAAAADASAATAAAPAAAAAAPAAAAAAAAAAPAAAVFTAAAAAEGSDADDMLAAVPPWVPIASEDDCLRCGLMKISGRFVEATVSVAPSTAGAELEQDGGGGGGGITVGVYDPILRETFTLTLSSADEIPDFDSFLAAVVAASSAEGSSDADVRELLSRLTLVEEEPGGRLVLRMRGGATATTAAKARSEEEKEKPRSLRLRDWWSKTEGSADWDRRHSRKRGTRRMAGGGRRGAAGAGASGLPDNPSGRRRRGGRHRGAAARRRTHGGGERGARRRIRFTATGEQGAAVLCEALGADDKPEHTAAGRRHCEVARAIPRQSSSFGARGR